MQRHLRAKGYRPAKDGRRSGHERWCLYIGDRKAGSSFTFQHGAKGREFGSAYLKRQAQHLGAVGTAEVVDIIGCRIDRDEWIARLKDRGRLRE